MSADTTPPHPTPRRDRHRFRAWGVGGVVLALVAASMVVSSTGSGQAARAVPGKARGLVPAIELLPLSTSADRRIVDSAGRQVLLRGANVNSLAEY
jgi:endoglycosylceramidase